MMEPNVLLDFDHVSMCYHDESGETEVLRDFFDAGKAGGVCGAARAVRVRKKSTVLGAGGGAAQAG